MSNANERTGLPLSDLLRKAQGQIKAGELAEAEELYKQILSKFPKNKKVIKRYQKLKAGIATQGTPTNKPSREQVQDLVNLYNQGQLEKVLEKVKPLISLFPKAISLHNIQGVSNAALKRYDAAIGSYKQAIKIKPNYAEAHSNMGDALKYKGHLDAAIDSYKQALKIKPDYAQAYWGVVDILNVKGEDKTLIECYEQEKQITSFIISEKFATSSGYINSKNNNESSFSKLISQLGENFEKTNRVRIINRKKSMIKLDGKIEIITKSNCYLSNVENKWVINGLTYRLLRELSAKPITDILASINSNVDELELNKSATYIAIGGANNYGHFIFEYLPKITWALSTIGPDCNFIINKCCKKWLALVDILALILCKRIPNYTIIDEEKIKKYTCLNPTFVESTFAVGNNFFYCYKTLRIMNQAIVNTYQKNSLQKKIYIARKEGPKSWRQLENKEEVRSVFKKKGYEVMNISGLSQENQLEILANTSELAVEGGADSAPSIFCPPDCRITELVPNNVGFVFGPLTTSVILGQNYQRIEGEKTKMNSGSELIDTNFKINPELIERLV